jgi:glutamine amidotransferase-like uncharacterized protein
MNKLRWIGGGALAVLLAVGALALGRITQREAVAAVPAGTILLFAGDGTSPNGVTAIKALLSKERLPFITADTRQLRGMSITQLRQFGLLIMPGGNFEVMGKQLGPEAPQRIREAVRGGLNYLGVCAGAFIAGDSPYNGINLTGRRFPFFADSRKGIRKAAIRLTNGDHTQFITYWEDGPELTGWGQPLAAYPDGTPAVAQGKVGAGWVILTGVHLEAPDDWYRGLAADSAATVSRGHAARVIHAAHAGQALPHL